VVALALTDHDTVGGVPEFLAAAAGGPVRAIGGVEVSCSWYDGTMHLLGLGVDPTVPALRQLLATVQASRGWRNEQILGKLRELGMPLPPATLRAAAGGGVVGRPHIAQALVAAGHCASLQEAFNRFIGHGRSAYVRRWLPLPEAAIRAIHAAGGIAVWAHPTAQMRHSPAKLRQTCRTLLRAGLDAVEAHYPEYAPGEVAMIVTVAAKLGLLVSGGSDFHGSNTPEIRLGSGRNGKLAVPESLLPPLLARMERIRAGGGGG